MKPLPRFTTVIHVKSDDQAIEQAKIAFDNGAGGIFLIDHDRRWPDLMLTYEKVRAEICYEGKWVGVNYLDVTPGSAVNLGGTMIGLDGLWTDGNSGIDLGRWNARTFNIFAGAAFKYQSQPADVAEEARRVSSLCDVVTTSGPGTGQAARVEKIQAMKEALGERPLALASGVTLDNVESFLPFVDCFLVSTGISKSFHEMDPAKVKAMSEIINSHGNPPL